MKIKPGLIAGALLLGWPVFAAAQVSPSVAFAPVTGIPIPLQSISGRFSSLNPVNRRTCSEKSVSGRVVTPYLIQVHELACGRSGHGNALVNIRLRDPADAAQMIAGQRLTIAATFKRAEEDREPTIVAEFLIGESARITAADPIDPAASPAPAFTSYMICQPPELDALAKQVGSEICAQSTLVANLAAMGPALSAAARTPSNASSDDDISGDGDAISCRKDLGISDRHLTALACARNSYWAWYKALRDPQFSMPAPL